MATAQTGPRAAEGGTTNRLGSEPSPYLRQHAHNPVDWWPWGEAAFAEARRRDVPVFLSIGYATCHWCHVMAHESFEDDDVAAAMNQAFVNIKVDREERPDIDDVYMAACQMMTGSGGWPLTAILTHAKKPFFTGTYFPKESRYGRIGMVDLVPRIAEAWAKQRNELEAQAEHIMLHVAGTPHGHEETGASGGSPQSSGTSRIGAATLHAGQAHLAKRFDPTHGGFGGAPKFPSPQHLLQLLRQHHRNRDPESLRMVTTTLDAMARGGVRDHLGGGFHRYSTDAQWLLPHFEKMLYDQAMLAMAYTEAFQATGDMRWQEVARSILDYVLRDLPDPAGGFRCAEDADSEGVEGKFYVWTKQEILAILGSAGHDFCNAYGVTEEGNFNDEATHHKTGANILHLPTAIAAAQEAVFGPMRQRLLAIRARRVRPLLDDKVLTDWNGLAIAAFAKAGRAFGEPRYVQAAVRAATFLRTTMRRPDGRLRHRFHAGRTDDAAFLDDHAFLLWGLVELYEATFEPQTLDWAVRVAADLQTHFADPAGGSFGTPDDGEDLGVRRKEGYDGAMPSGNSAAAYALHKLGLLTGDARWTAAGDATIAAFAGQLTSSPAAFSMMLCALDLAVGPTQEVVIAGSSTEANAMLNIAAAGYNPRRVVLRAMPALATAAPWTAQHKAPAGEARAYVCEGFSCKQPTDSSSALSAALRKP